jgi:L-phenylalanine/L-methionine N-acetyltransferase
MDTPPFPELTFRAAGPADAEAIAALQALPGFRHGTLRLPFPRPEEIRQWLERTGPDGRELLGFTGTTLVAVGGLQRLPGRRSHVGHIGMGVHDAWQGKGVGTALMGELITFGERWLGLRRLELTVFVDNAPAIALYRKYGFAVEGTHRAYALRDGVLVDAYAMARLSA